MSQQLVRRDAPAVLDTIRDMEERFDVAVRQRELLAKYIKDRLTPGKHFYRVGTEEKDSLTKEGAELICLPHGYKPAYFWEAGPEQPSEDDTPYQITIRCRLLKGDQFEGEGIGSASSHVTKKTGERVVRMRDIGLRHNATAKVAQKSAYIAAVLNATAASEFFTQDMEDALVVEGTAQSVHSPDRYCAEHKTQWFKSGKMRAYAHPIKDSQGKTVSWCNMPKPSEEAQETVEGETPSGGQVSAPPDQETPILPTLASVDALRAWAKGIGYPDDAAIRKTLSISDLALLGPNLQSPAMTLWRKRPQKEQT